MCIRDSINAEYGNGLPEMPSQQDVSLSIFSFGGLMFGCGTLLLGSYQGMAKMSDIGHGQPVSTPIAILVMETLKLGVSYFKLKGELSPDELGAAFRSIKPKDMLMYGVPGLCYAFNNNLEIVALRFMDPATNRLLNNLKIVSTALMFRSIMSKQITGQQVVALAMLLCGSCLASTAHGSGQDGELYVTTAGILVMILYGFVSGFAGVFNEYIMKQGVGADLSIHLQNLLLYSWGILLNGSAALLYQSTSRSAGFETAPQTVWWILFVLNGAFHGLVISAVIKYLSSIFKLFMSACAIFVAGALQLVLFNASHLPISFVVAAAIVSAALYLYNTPNVLPASMVASFDLAAPPEDTTFQDLVPISSATTVILGKKDKAEV
eukprot:TRINITY_DN3319_c0_g1_i2.p1 TRINITY_DN3319_c0_g1~~TRINITY_DN3319_c0_g1_i2.p1  ORF type:complete len:379 (+),score=98.31 TRINITY_DN3319_c0_g1_i2:117-1253(+)